MPVSQDKFLRKMTLAEFDALLCDAATPTADDVSITTDGRRLDSKEAVLAFCAELAAERTHAVS